MSSMRRPTSTAVLLTSLLALSLAAPGFAGAVRNLPGFSTNTLAANDDSSTGLVNIGFTINLFGTNYTQLYVNNNGNVTFDTAMSSFTPFSLLSTSRKVLAPFFADVDTRNVASGVVHYGTDTVGGRPAFGVEWPAVGYFGSHADKLNTFELVIIDRSDTGAGNFDFEFNYNQIQWETGDASGGSGGLGGSSARAGFSNGSTVSFEIPGSAVNGALLDSGPKALINQSIGNAVLGRDVFNVRNGSVSNTPAVPVPPSLWLVGGGLAAYGLKRFRRRAA